MREKINTLCVAIMVAAIASACSTNPTPVPAPKPIVPPPAPPAALNALNPVGVYRILTSVQGQDVHGTLTVEGVPTKYTAVLSTDISPDIRFETVTVSGRQITLTGPSPDGNGSLTMTITVNADSTVSGGWSMSSDTGTLTGTKVS